MAEAESILPERSKMASSISVSINDGSHNSSILDRGSKALPTSSPSPSPVSTLPETLHGINGSLSSPVISSPITTPAKSSTLRKSSGKKKPSKSSKDTKSKHSKGLLQNSPDQSERDNGECPYSDLESVPKILCPKALERQSKLLSTPPTVTVVKEVKKQPEIQSGLWFSKSGKDRRPKTTSPMSDRKLFSKASCKKKSLPAVSKKRLVTCVSSSGAINDQSGMSDKHKTLVPAEANLPAGQSEQLKCKNTPVSNRLFSTTGSLADHSGLSDKQRSRVPVEAVVPNDKCGYSKFIQTPSNITDTVIDMLSDQFVSSDDKTCREHSMKVGINDQSRFSECLKRVSQTEHPDNTANKKMHVIDRISDQAEEKERNKTPKLSTLNVDTTDPLAILEKQTSLVSKCRLPFVKLVRKEIEGEKFENSSVTSSPADQPGSTKKKKTREKKETKISSKKSDWVDDETSVSMDKASSSETINVSVVRLKASGGKGMLQLSSESSQQKTTVVPNVASVSADELGSPQAERKSLLNVSPSNVTFSSSNQSDQSESKKIPSSNAARMSSDLSGSSAQTITSVTSKSSNAIPATKGNLVSGNACVSKVLSSDKSKKVVQKSKQVPDELNKVILEPPAHLPASSRLLTRALKAMQEVEQKKQENAKKQAEHKELLDALREVKDSVCHSARNSSRGPKTKLKISTKIKSLKSKDNGDHNQDTSSSRSSPPARSSDSTDVEADVKSEAEDHSISSTPPMDFIPLTSKAKEKNDDHSSALCSSSSPSSPFSFMNAFKNVEEVSFQSVTSEGNGKPVSFKPDTNYKFSTFLMMLKDLHDTRERDGTPLELDIGPPSAHVKEEPSVMPGEAKPAGQDQQFKHLGTISNLSPDKITITHSVDGKSQTWKRPYNRRSSCTGMKKRSNRKVPCRPARSGPGFPGLESTSRMASLPTADSSSRMDCLSRVQSLLGLQASSWDRHPGGGEGVVQDEGDERWSRVNLQNLQNMVPLEQQGSDTTLHLGPPNGFFAGRTKTNPSFTHNAGGREKATTGKSSGVGPNAEAQSDPNLQR